MKCSKPFALTIASAIQLGAYWKFDEAGAVNRVDSKSGYDFLYQAGFPVGSAAGIINNGVLIASPIIAGFMITAAAAGLTFNAAKGMTICGWVKANPAVTFRSFFFTLGNSWFFNISRQATSWTFAGLDMGGNSDGIAIPVNAGFNGVLWFFRCWLDPIDFKLRCKLNEGATVVGTVALNNWAAVDTPSATVSASNSHTTTDLFDEFGIWNGVLSDVDGAYLYNAGAGKSFPDVPYA